jgi:aryl-alcohol dehydrogenase-like predicted oxidoreductase
MTMFSHLGLGTVQFGLDYGISNRAGRPTETEVAQILDRAVEAGVGYLDTAAGYGEAEILIGRNLPPSHRLRIVTKMLPIQENKIVSSDKRRLLDGIASSLDRLRTGRIYAVLAHHGSDFGKPGSEYLTEVLQEVKARGWVERVGASVYEGKELSLILNQFQPDLIQLPVNVLDRRLIVSGWLDRLKALGVEVHARSIFLQGLLLMEASKTPEFFAPLRTNLSHLQDQWAAQRLVPMAGCLSFILHQACFDAAIIGINSLKELEEVSAVAETVENGDFDFGSYTPVDPRYLDPRRWPSFSPARADR